jgi:hypothetical protein
MKIGREMSNKHKAEKYQVFEADHNKKAIEHPFKKER